MADNELSGAGEKVITAKLVRGKVYSFNDGKGQYLTFKRNVPVEVTADVAARLEILTEELEVDGDLIERDLFKIDYDAERRSPEDEAPRKLRMRIVPADESSAKRTTPVLQRRAPPPGTKPGLRTTAR